MASPLFTPQPPVQKDWNPKEMSEQYEMLANYLDSLLVICEHFLRQKVGPPAAGQTQNDGYTEDERKIAFEQIKIITTLIDSNYHNSAKNTADNAFQNIYVWLEKVQPSIENTGQIDETVVQQIENMRGKIQSALNKIPQVTVPKPTN